MSLAVIVSLNVLAVVAVVAVVGYLIDRSAAKGKGSGPAAVEREARRA